MTDDSTSKAGLPGLLQQLPGYLLLVLIGGYLLVRFQLLFLMNINWDEFRFLSDVYSYQRDDLSAALQTFHVHLFSWLTTTPGTEAEQIFSARVVMHGLQTGSCVLLYLVSRQFHTPTAALFVVFSYLSFSFVIIHGASYRFDPIVVFLCLASLYCVFLNRWRFVATTVSGVIFALALLISIKSLFFLPILFLSVLVMDWRKERPVATSGRAVYHFVILFISFMLLYLLHKSTLASEKVWVAGNYVTGAGKRVILSQSFIPQWRDLERTLVQDWPLWLFILSGLILVLYKLAKSAGEERRRCIALSVFLVSLVPVLFYRNTFPYYYVVMLIPAVILSGELFTRVESGFGHKSLSRYPVLPVLMILCVAYLNFSTVKKQSFDQTVSQRELLDVVHKAFPDPVPYIDRCSFVSSFRKVGFFMSSWGLAGYIERNNLIMERKLDKDMPVFLLVNSRPLNISGNYEQAVVTEKYRLFEADWKTLKNNYIHHWGRIFVAGKKVHLTSNHRKKNVKISIPGWYTLEAENSFLLDGQIRNSGDVVQLVKGEHLLESESGEVSVTLRWGDHLYRPTHPPTRMPLFYGL